MGTDPDGPRPTGGDPAEKDYLGHTLWAKALIRFIAEVLNPTQEQDKQEQGNHKIEPQSFLMLLDGSWGVGKSSLLRLVTRFCKEDWTAAGFSEAREMPVIVEINAWLHQHSGPLWWTLVERTLSAAEAQVEGGFLRRTWRRLRIWNLRSEPGLLLVLFVVAALVVFVVSALVLLVVVLVDIASRAAPTEPSVAADVWALWGAIMQWAATLSGAGQGLGYVVLGVLTVLSFVVGRLWPRRAAVESILKSTPVAIKEAQAYYRTKFFAVVGRPCLVIVEDLDRCDPAFVVESLYALQTVLRSPKFVFVVAADRRWLRLCIEQHFGGLAPHLVHDGTTLGSRFLDKIFQLSVQVPRLGDGRAWHYAEQVFVGFPKAPTLPGGATDHGDVVENPRQESNPTQPDDAAAGVGKSILGDEEILCIASQMFNGTPRAINRFANELRFQRLLSAAMSDSHRSVAPACIAWIILRVRWPALAELIEDQPRMIEALPTGFAWNGDEPAAELFPEALRSIFATEDYRRLVNSELFPDDKAQLIACLYLPELDGGA
jgi:hypothetical protein